jgi:hypothetical protein
MATISKIIDMCKQRFGLVNVHITKGKKITLRLHGFKHEQAKDAVIERFLKEAPENLRFPREWSDVDQIRTGKNFLGIHQIDPCCNSDEWKSVVENFKKTMPKANIVTIARL